MQDARRQGGVAQDDDGNPLVKGQGYDSLEVAHIMPHSLTQLNASKQLVCAFTSPNRPPLLIVVLLGPFQGSSTSDS